MKKIILALSICSLFLSGCAETEFASHVYKNLPGANPPAQQGDFKVGKPYRIAGKTYVPSETYNHTETGIASWYGSDFHGRRTANGEIFDRRELTAAHRTLQMPSLVRVTNLENGRSLIVRVNDRGPFKKSRVIDLSERAAELLGFKSKGTARVRLQVLTEESRALAEAAKRGEDTRGIEVAMNQNRQMRDNMLPPKTLNYPADRPAPTPSLSNPVYSEVASAETLPAYSEQMVEAPVPGHFKGDAFLPDEVVKQLPVSSNSIYVQAGSFGDQMNAQNLAESLSSFGNAQVYPALVNGRQFYRVRIGPIADVSQADIVLANLSNAGKGNAVIVVD